MLFVGPRGGAMTRLTVKASAELILGGELSDIILVCMSETILTTSCISKSQLILDISR